MKTEALLILTLLSFVLSPGCGSTQKTASFNSGIENTNSSAPNKDLLPIVLDLSKDDQYLVYYDRWDENKIASVRNRFKVIILHPGEDGTNITAQQVEQLKNGGSTKIFGYLTIGEDETCSGDQFKDQSKKLQCGREKLPYNDKLGPVVLMNGTRKLQKNGYPSYLVDLDGDKEPDINKSFGSFYVDAANEAWKKLVLERASKVAKLGVDGFFLDTLDTAGDFAESRAGMIELMAAIKTTEFDNKRMILVANRGLFFFKKGHCEICNSVSAVMFEDLFTDQCVSKHDDPKCKQDSSGIEAPFLTNGNGQALSDLRDVQVDYPRLQVLVLEYVGRKQKKPPCKDLLAGTLEKLTKGITMSSSNFSYDGRYPYYVAPGELNIPKGGKSEDYFPIFTSTGKLDYANWCN
jgi:endo-alpha-1,4-polygalactosaminidase (GH114 family)